VNIQEVYKHFEFRVNKLGTNAGQRFGLPQFVAAINKAQLHWVEARARISERDGIIVDELRPLLSEWKKQGVKKGEGFRTRYEVTLPENYFHLVRADSTTDCGPLFIRRTEEGNINALLQDEYSKPSKEWEEALGTIFQNTLRVYTNGFSIGNVEVKYYRYPTAVDIEGYSKEGGVASGNVDMDFDGAAAHEIIDIAALISSSDTADQERWQTLTQLVQSNP
jgi:hypothetical protein